MPHRTIQKASISGAHTSQQQKSNTFSLPTNNTHDAIAPAEVHVPTKLSSTQQQQQTVKQCDADINASENPPLSPTIQSHMVDIMNQYIDRALSHIDTIDYTFVPANAEINAILGGPDSPPVYQLPNDNRPYVCIRANGLECLPLFDSGSMVCIIVYREDDELKPFGGEIEPCDTRITTISRENTRCTGLMNIEYTFCGQKKVIPTLLFKGNKSQFIVGINFWSAFGIRFAWNEKKKQQSLSHIDPLNAPSNSSTATLENVSTIEVHCHAIINDIQPMGILNLAQNRSAARRVRPYLPKWHESSHKTTSTVRKFMPTSAQAVYMAPIYTTYESIEKDEISHNIETPSHGEELTEWTPAQAVVSVLAHMPRKAGVSEVAIQSNIRTAEDATDTVNDILPEKHSCISQPHQLTAEQRAILDQVVAEFPYTSEHGPLNITNVYTQRINTGDAIPQMKKQYPLSPYVMNEVEREIQSLIERDIIEPIDFSPWRWPILWVRKKSGGGRICVDARGLNKITIPDAYPTLNVDTILRNLPKAKFITCLDMTQAFHQIEIDPVDRRKTSFAIGHRFYCFKRAIMGFINSPADLAKVLDKVFGDLIPHVYHYVDDFVLISSTFEKHMDLLREVAKRLRTANLTISREKSSFCYSRVEFLGYVLTKEGLIANMDRVRPIIDYPRPKTVKELRRWVGLVGWYRRFIDKAAELLAPLTDLMKGDSKAGIEWNESAEEAFINTKRALLSTAVLAAPDYRLPFKIYTDASLVAGAAVLTQVQDGREKVIAFHSVKFSRTQQNYSATERECLAVISGVEKFRPYVDGVPFTVVTDHSSLRWLQNLREPHGKLARWAVRLQAFDITFEHRPGKLMVVPDALSRAVDIIDVQPKLKTDDKWYGQTYSFAESGKAYHYKVENDTLYRRGKFCAENGDRIWTVCIPQEKVGEVLNEKHDQQGHIGFWKTLKAIKKMYFWPKMNEQVFEHVSKCVTCKQIKPSTENTRVTTGKYQNPISVGRVLSVDLVGPLPPSKHHKHTWLMVAVDAFSKYVFIKTVTRATAYAITDWLERDIFFKFNVPEKVMTDNGTQFTSEWFQTFLQKYRVVHVTTPVYHPQPNSVEASNKSVKQILRAELLGQPDHSNWADYVHRAVMYLNTNARIPTGFSPHYIVYGQEKTNTGNEYRVIRDINQPFDSETDKRNAIYEEAAENQRTAYEINRRRHDLRASTRKFKPGDIVFVRIQRQSSAGDKYTQKLAPIKKPAIVKTPMGSDTYILTDWSQKEIGKYHANDIFTQ